MDRTTTESHGHYRPGMTGRYRFLRRLVLAFGGLFIGFTVHGEERTHRSGPLIVAANHTRYLDPVLVCMAVPRRIQWMAKKELFIFPFRKFFALLGAFPVDRQKGGRSAVRAALSLLAEGWALGIFPEGTHRSEGVSRQAKSGTAMLAARSGAPVLPVYIGKVPGPLARLRGEKTHAYVGEPLTIHNTKRSGREYREVADEILSRIYALPGESGYGAGR